MTRAPNQKLSGYERVKIALGAPGCPDGSTPFSTHWTAEDLERMNYQTNMYVRHNPTFRRTTAKYTRLGYHCHDGALVHPRTSAGSRVLSTFSLMMLVMTFGTQNFLVVAQLPSILEANFVEGNKKKEWNIYCPGNFTLFP